MRCGATGLSCTYFRFLMSVSFHHCFIYVHLPRKPHKFETHRIANKITSLCCPWICIVWRVKNRRTWKLWLANGLPGTHGMAACYRPAWRLYRSSSCRGVDKSLARPDLKKNRKVAIFRPTRRSLLPRRPGWTDNLLNCF